MSEIPGVINFHVSKRLADHSVASGAITGNQHAAEILELVRERDEEAGSIVLFDFTGIDLATASYLKATVLWATTCGRMHAGIINPEELRRFDGTQYEPLNIFPAVAGGNDEIETELQEVFGGRGLACVSAFDWTPEKILKCKILGRLEPTAVRTLKALRGLPEFTAHDLEQRLPAEGVNTTAWNNRLAELHRLRLLCRRKQGKFWKYRPVADQLIYG